MTNEDPEEMLDEKLLNACAALPREIQPTRDLWPGIAARIAPRRRFMRLASLAAAVALISAGAIVAAILWGHPTLGPRLATRAPQEPAAVVMPQTERAVAIAASVRESTRLDPKTQAVLLRNLAIIENSLDDIQQALRQDPGNPGLQQLLYQMYRSEAALLDAAQRVQLQSTTGVAT